MDHSGIPSAVQDFVRRHIDSVEQLDVMLLLHRTAPRVWTPVGVGTELRIDPGSAARRLADLNAGGLLEASAEGDAVGYRYAAAAPEDEVIRQLAVTYLERRTSLIEFIFSAPVRDVRVFADAFRIRKKED